MTKEEHIKTLSKVAPEGCNLKVGDTVKWVNDNGIEWQHKILGFNHTGEYNKTYKCYVHLDKDSYWFPIDHNKLELVNGR